MSEQGAVTPITKKELTKEQAREKELSDLVEKLKSQHDLEEVVAVDTRRHGFIVCRPPTQPEFERFQNGVRRSDQSHKRMRTTEAIFFRQFVAATMIHPTGDAITALLEKLPALPAKLADQICELAGADDEFEVKKL